MATARTKTTRGRHTAKNSGAQPPAPVLAPTDSYDPDTATISSQESDPPSSPPPHDTSQIAKTSADSRYRDRRSPKKTNELAMDVGAGAEQESTSVSRPRTRAYTAKLHTKVGAGTEPGAHCRAVTGVERRPKQQGKGREQGELEAPPHRQRQPARSRQTAKVARKEAKRGRILPPAASKHPAPHLSKTD